jgi:hypothetical protein
VRTVPGALTHSPPNTPDKLHLIPAAIGGAGRGKFDGL